MRRLLTKTDRLAARWVPKNAHEVANNERAAAYCYPAHGSKVIALCYRGSAAKPEIHCTYKDIDRATEVIAAFLLSVDERAARKATASAQRKAWPNPIKVGEIFHTSWGYDQTNVDFYIVTRVSGKRVWIRPIAQDSEATGFMSGKCWPKMPIEMTGPETMHLARVTGENQASLNIHGHYGSREDGRAHYFSSYA